jgi:hypothetical protein
MQRGIIQLNNTRMQLLLQILKQNQSVDQLLMNKLSSNHHDQPQVTLELSEDEAETLIDSLEMPRPSDDQQLVTLRRSLQEFLTKLRFPADKAVPQ